MLKARMFLRKYDILLLEGTRSRCKVGIPEPKLQARRCHNCYALVLGDTVVSTVEQTMLYSFWRSCWEFILSLV